MALCRFAGVRFGNLNTPADLAAAGFTASRTIPPLLHSTRRWRSSARSPRNTASPRNRWRCPARMAACLPGTRPTRSRRRLAQDVRGDDVLRAGEVLTPARVSLAASLGIASLPVARKPTVAVFTTGDELVEPGMPLAPGQIYDSNRELLMGLLRADGLEPTAWPRLPDDPRQVEIALRDAGCAFDLVITCGACPPARRTISRRCWRSSGNPFLEGADEAGHAVARSAAWTRRSCSGLPGNPVSVLATYLTLGRALIDGLQGRTEPRPRWRARLARRSTSRIRGANSCAAVCTAATTARCMVDAESGHRLAPLARGGRVQRVDRGARRRTHGWRSRRRHRVTISRLRLIRRAAVRARAIMQP